MCTHIPVGHVPVRALAVGQHLPHDDAVAPHVAGRGELAECDGLRSRPANGDLPPLKKEGTVEANVRDWRSGREDRLCVSVCRREGRGLL